MIPLRMPHESKGEKYAPLEVYEYKICAYSIKNGAESK
jgi:hypothetical protein